MNEQDLKLSRVRELLDQRALEAVVLRRFANIAWASCGADLHLHVADGLGCASLLITRSGQYVLTDNVEEKRLQEEQHLRDQGWEFEATPWYEDAMSVAELIGGGPVGADTDLDGATNVAAELALMRCQLVPEEIQRFRRLSQLCAEAIDAAILSIRPGISEQQIAGLLARDALSRGVEPIENLVGTDDRLLFYRNPFPSEKRLERYAVLTLCGRRWGLVASITRAVHFGHLPDELKRKETALANVDACLIVATRPGNTLGHVFQEAMQAYETNGFSGEWRRAHQGGLAGYAPRESYATPMSRELVEAGQVFAWNPSVPGARSEDTMLVGEQRNEILTAIPRWPSVRISVGGQMVDRPRIMELL